MYKGKVIEGYQGKGIQIKANEKIKEMGDKDFVFIHKDWKGLKLGDAVEFDLLQVGQYKQAVPVGGLKTETQAATPSNAELTKLVERCAIAWERCAIAWEKIANK